MTDQRYEASRRTVGALLSATSPRIKVPEWQRSYSWGSEQFERFWSDLENFDAKYPNNTLENQEYFLGSIVLVTGSHSLLLLDGQQRLATATILLASLRDARRPIDERAADRLQSKYIRDFNDATQRAEYLLTLNSYDSTFFQRAIQDDMSGPSPSPTLKSHSLILRAKEYFDRQLAEHRAVQSENIFYQWNLRIQRVLTDHMSVVAIASSDADNAASVFETLNDRGIGLSTPDLLRNLLLRLASNDTRRDRMIVAWRQVLEINDEGVNVDQFLRHYWVSTHGDVKTRALYREIKGKIESEDINVVEFCDKLADAASIYVALVKSEAGTDRLRKSLQDISDLSASVLYPLLLSAFSEIKGDPDELAHFAETLVKIYVRYNIIGGKESSVFESHVYSCATDLRKDRNLSVAANRMRQLVPSLTEFQRNFAVISITKRGAARYLLVELEKYLRLTEELDVAGAHRVHLEHIYPQNPPAGSKAPNHAGVVNRLGNLTLLSRSLNTSAKNSNFSAKKTTAYIASEIELTRDLLTRDPFPSKTWRESDIKKRQIYLAKLAVKVWKFDDEAVPLDSLVENDIDVSPMERIGQASLFDLILPEDPA